MILKIAREMKTSCCNSQKLDCLCVSLPLQNSSSLFFGYISVPSHKLHPKELLCNPLMRRVWVEPYPNLSVFVDLF